MRMTDDLPREKVVELLQSEWAWRLAENFNEIKGIGLDRASERGLISPEAIDRLAVNGLLDERAKHRPLNDTGRMLIYALCAWASQRDAQHDFVRDSLRSIGGQRLLDVGCGEGYLLWHALKEGARHVVGIDLLPTMVRFSQAALQVHAPDAPDRVLVCRAEAERLPFPRASFDVLTVRLALQYMDLPRAVPEISRVLAPGGRLYMRVNTPWRLLRQSLLNLPRPPSGETLVSLANTVPAFFGLPAWLFRFGGRESRTVGLLRATVRRWFTRNGFRIVSMEYARSQDVAPDGERRVLYGAFHAALERLP